MSTYWQPGFDATAVLEPESVVLAFAGGRVVVTSDEDPSAPTLRSLPPGLIEDARVYAVGRLGTATVFAAVLAQLPDPGRATTIDLRSLLTAADAPGASAAMRAAMVAEWELAHAFCGRCGSPTQASATEFARICACGAHFYPRITPAAIMLVEREGKVLLARRAGLQRPFYSVLAGFVEPGETLEETVRREVLEEVAIDVQDVRYFGSQPWPFPSQLMVGFTARYASGEIRVDDVELAEADWYAPDALPPIPPGFTIARTLIDDFLARHA